MVKLEHHNFKKKYMKASINESIYFTEALGNSTFLSWHDLSFFFFNVSPNSVLCFELLENGKEANKVLGKCKIPLPCLNLSLSNQTLDYDDYIRNEQEDSIGSFSIKYQVVERRGKSLTAHELELGKKTFRKLSVSKNDMFPCLSRNKKIERNLTEGRKSQMKQSRLDNINLSNEFYL